MTPAPPVSDVSFVNQSDDWLQFRQVGYGRSEVKGGQVMMRPQGQPDCDTDASRAAYAFYIYVRRPKRATTFSVQACSHGSTRGFGVKVTTDQNGRVIGTFNYVL